MPDDLLPLKLDSVWLKPGEVKVLALTVPACFDRLIRIYIPRQLSANLDVVQIWHNVQGLLEKPMPAMLFASEEPPLIGVSRWEREVNPGDRLALEVKYTGTRADFWTAGCFSCRQTSP